MGRNSCGRRRLVLLGGAMAVAVAVSSWAHTVSACSCLSDPMVFPPAGFTGMPRNWQLWGHSLDRDEASGTPSSRLYGPEGEVPSRLRRLAVAGTQGSPPGHFPILVPNEPLRPNTEYRIEPHPDEGYYLYDSPHTFTTGDIMDTQPPLAPAVLDITWVDNGASANDCAPGPRLTITLSAVEGLLLLHTSPVGSSEEGGSGRAREMSWYGYALPLQGVGSSEGERIDPARARSQVVLGGVIPCELGWSQPGPHIFRIAALDHAGLLSEWTEIPGPLDLSEAPSDQVLSALPVQGNGPKGFARPLYRGEPELVESNAGCALAPSTTSATGLAPSILFALAWFVRRTRTTRPRAPTRREGGN